jgi:elongation factor Ts
MTITVDIIKQLRSETGAGIMECRNALEQSGGRYEAALETLQARTMVRAQKQAEREARQGRIELYSHGGGRIGVMVEVNTETEFAARSEAFRHFAHELALHIAAEAPLYVSNEDLPEEVLEALARDAAEKARRAGKPERVVERIVAGVLEKYRNRHVLLRQPYFRDEAITVAQMLSRVINQVGENIVIRRFQRWEITPDAETEAGS